MEHRRSRHLLHLKAELGSGDGARGVASLVEAGNGLLTSIGGESREGLTGLVGVGNAVGTGATEDDNVEQRVGTETVSTVDGDASSLTGSVEAWDNGVGVTVLEGKDLTVVVGGNTTHVVVDGGNHRDGLLGDVNTGKDGGSLRDARETLVEDFSGEVREIEEDYREAVSDSSRTTRRCPKKSTVILVGTAATALTDLNGGRARDDVTRGKVLRGRGIALHVALTRRVAENTALTAGTLSDEATGTIDTSRMELDELEILAREASASDHGVTVTSAGVSGRAREVSATIATSGEDSVLRTGTRWNERHLLRKMIRSKRCDVPEAVERAILKAEGNNTNACAILHQEVKGKVLDEELAVMAERLTVESVEHGVTSAVSGGGAALSLEDKQHQLEPTRNCRISQ